MPTGVSATFSPTTTLTTSVLKLTATATVAPGTYGATVKGVCGSVAKTDNILITVPTPNFAVVRAQNSVTVIAGGPGVSDAITISNPLNYVAAVRLSVSGLPTGLTSALGTPNAITGSSLIFTAAVTVTPGTYPIAVTGKFGTVTRTASISLTVPVPSFSLTTSASALTLLDGSGTKLSVTVIKPLNLGKSLALSVSGLPTGVTATFSPTSTLRTSVMTIVAAATAPAGAYTATVKGTFGNVVNPVTVQITVPARTFAIAATQASVSVAKGTSNSGTVVSAVNPSGIGGKDYTDGHGDADRHIRKSQPKTIAPTGTST